MTNTLSPRNAKLLVERVLDYTSGTKTGAILACALGVRIPAPCFVGKAVVTSDGFVMCSFRGPDGNYHPGAFVGSVADLDRNLSNVSSDLGLNAAEYNHLAAAITNWIATDYRPSKDIYARAVS